MNSSNIPHQPQNELSSNGNRRIVDADGGHRPASLGTPQVNLRPQSSSANAGRASNIDAFAAAQVHSFGSPAQLENRINAIAWDLQRREGGRSPTPHDVHLIVYLLEQLPPDDPALVNHHIIDAVLPLDQSEVESIVAPIQRGECTAAYAVEVLQLNANPNLYSPLAAHFDPSVDFTLTTPVPGSGAATTDLAAASGCPVEGEVVGTSVPTDLQYQQGHGTDSVVERRRLATIAAAESTEDAERVQRAIDTLDQLRPNMSPAEHAALSSQFYEQELVLLTKTNKSLTGLEALGRAADASRLREKQADHRAHVLETALEDARQHPYCASQLARVARACDRLNIDPLAALAIVNSTFSSSPHIPMQLAVNETLSLLTSGEATKFDDAWHSAVRMCSGKRTSSLTGTTSDARSVGLPRSPSAPEVTAPPLISGMGLLPASLSRSAQPPLNYRAPPSAQYGIHAGNADLQMAFNMGVQSSTDHTHSVPPTSGQPVRTLFDDPLATYVTTAQPDVQGVLARIQRLEESLKIERARADRAERAARGTPPVYDTSSSTIAAIAKETWEALNRPTARAARSSSKKPLPPSRKQQEDVDDDEEAYYCSGGYFDESEDAPLPGAATSGPKTAFSTTHGQHHFTHMPGNAPPSGSAVAGASVAADRSSPVRGSPSATADRSSPTRGSPGPADAITLCGELGIDTSLAVTAAAPVWFVELDLLRFGLDTSAVSTKLEPYMDKFVRSLRAEKRRQKMSSRPPDYEKTLKDFIVIPQENRQAYASNYGRILECILDLFFVQLYQESEADPAANATLGILSNLAVKVPGLNPASLTVIRLEPSKRTGHDGIDEVLKEVTLHYLSGTAESGEQWFFAITWESNATAAQNAPYGNTAAHLFQSLVQAGIPINKTELQVIQRWRAVINNTASKDNAQGAHASQVASIYTRAGGQGVKWNTFEELRPTFNPETGQPIAARIPLPSLGRGLRPITIPASSNPFSSTMLSEALEEVSEGRSAEAAGAQPTRNGAKKHDVVKPSGHLVNFRKAAKEGRVAAWKGITFPPMVNKNRADGFYTLDCPRCMMKESKALENKAKGLPCEMSYKEYHAHTGSGPSHTNQPSERGIVISHPLEFCHHIKMDLVFHVRNNPDDASYLEHEDFKAFRVRFEAERLSMGASEAPQ